MDAIPHIGSCHSQTKTCHLQSVCCLVFGSGRVGPVECVRSSYNQTRPDKTWPAQTRFLFYSTRLQHLHFEMLCVPCLYMLYRQLTHVNRLRPLMHPCISIDDATGSFNNSHFTIDKLLCIGSCRDRALLKLLEQLVHDLLVERRPVCRA